MARVEQVPSRANSRRGASFWTVSATIAGLIGAAAAVYPLLQNDQQLLHLTISDDRTLRAETLSEAVVLTGNWHIRRVRRWWRNEVVFQSGRDDRIIDDWWIKDRRVPANSSERTYVTTVDAWSGVRRCDLGAGEFEFGLEFKSKTGLAWTHITLPLCIIPPEEAAARARVEEKWAKINAEREAARVRAEVEAAEARARALEAKAQADEEARVAKARADAEAARVRADAQVAKGRGDAHVAEGEHRRAISEYTNAIKIDGAYGEAYSKRGDAYIALGLEALAIEDYRAALRLRCISEPKMGWPCNREPK